MIEIVIPQFNGSCDVENNVTGESSSIMLLPFSPLSKYPLSLPIALLRTPHPLPVGFVGDRRYAIDHALRSNFNKKDFFAHLSTDCP